MTKLDFRSERRRGPLTLLSVAWLAAACLGPGTTSTHGGGPGEGSLFSYAGGLAIEIFNMLDEHKEATQNGLIFFRIKNTRGLSEYYLPESNAYLMKATLLDPEGRSVPATRAGTEIGSRWDKVPLAPERSNKRDSRSIIFKTKSKDMWTRRITDSNRIVVLFNLEEMFQTVMNKTYFLHLEFQLVVRSQQGGTNSFKLVRFPVIKFPVTLQPRQVKI